MSDTAAYDKVRLLGDRMRFSVHALWSGVSPLSLVNGEVVFISTTLTDEPYTADKDRVALIYLRTHNKLYCPAKIPDSSL